MADCHLACDTLAYHHSHAARRSRTSCGPMPVTRTSLPGAAVVAVVNKWRARRCADARLSQAFRSTAERHVDMYTVGTANTARRISAGWIETSKPIVTPRRKIHEQ